MSSLTLDRPEPRAGEAGHGFAEVQHGATETGSASARVHSAAKSLSSDQPAQARGR
jgi:hypothetical protein